MKNTTKIQWHAALFSAAGIVVVAVLLIAVNMIADGLNMRADFTDEKLYTLSDGTRAIIEDLDTSVNIRFYYSKSAADMPVHLKSYASRVQDLLQEYRRASNGRLGIDKFDPQPDSDAEDAARLDGISGRTVSTGRRIYLGVAVHCLDETVTLAYLDPAREAQLEYDLTRAIHRVTHPEKPTVCLLSSLPVAGTPDKPMMGQPDQDGSEPWMLVRELKKQFEVTRLDAPETIPDTVDVLLLIHPKTLSDPTLFAIDQYLLNGGRILAFLDPMSIIDLQLNPQGRFSQPQPSDLAPLLDTWGVQFDTDSLVVDHLYKSTIPGPDGQMQEYLPFLELGPDAVNAEHPAVAELDRILLPFAGHFEHTGTDDTLTRTVLLHTSEKSGTVPKFMAQVGGDQMAGNIKNEGGQKTLALQLNGRFETAFPDGNPADEEDADPDTDQPRDFLKQSRRDSTVVLVADADMLHDRFCVSRQQTLFGHASTLVSDNLPLAQNLTELLSGAGELIGIRSRGSLNRPFKVIREKTAEARAKYQDKIAELEAELAEAENRLQKLQQGKSENDKYFLTPEQEQEIESFEKKRAEINRELKTLRRSLRKEIVALENRLKWLNIAGMPAVVVLIGLGFSLHRKRRMAKK